MASDPRNTRSSRSDRSISVAVAWHVVVANTLRTRRGYRALCEIVTYSGCHGLFLHNAGCASNRLRVFGGMRSCPSPFVFVFFNTSAAPVSPRDGRCADERQCRSKWLFCPVLVRGGVGRGQGVG